jgi:branched-subunit amino acid transport protein
VTTIIAFVVAAAITYGLRSCMTLAGERLSTSSRLASAVGLVSPAVLTAFVVSALVFDRGHLSQPGVVETMAVGSALLAVRRTGNVSMALAIGLPVYWLGALAGWV